MLMKYDRSPMENNSDSIKFTSALVKLLYEVYSLAHGNSIIPATELKKCFSTFEKFGQMLDNLVKQRVISRSVAEYYVQLYLSEVQKAA